MTRRPDHAPPSVDQLFLDFQSAVAGRYSIDRELGRGGMGVVYLAREVHLDRSVAIKLLPPELSSRAALRERFVREAQLSAKLSHPNIIPIYSVEQSAQFVYYVMAYVDGETLTQRVQSRGPLSASDGVRVLREVAWALGYAHDNGVIHRDVKPDNILIEAATGRALVADFGIAVLAGDAHGDGACGTPEFMSPEQAAHGAIDARSDVYSLGATAFFAMSGRLPFEGRTAAELIGRQMSTPAPSLGSVNAAVPRRLVQVIDRCLARDPASRPESAQQLAEQLGVVIEQRRELPAALRAFVRRNGRMDGGGTLLGLVGGLFASVATSATAGAGAAVMVLGATFVAMPAVFGVVAARRLLALGFSHADLAPAFRTESDASREERGTQLPGRWSIRRLLERGARGVAGVFGTTSTVLLILTLFQSSREQADLLGFVCATAFVLSVLAAFVYLALLQARRDVDVEFWSAVWTGRFGSTMFAVAKRLQGSKPVNRAMTHRATELSLGIAAEQLFESLPAASREHLGDIPTLLDRLQQDAHHLRKRYDALQDALGRSTENVASEHYARTCEERDAVREQLSRTVAALETIRLGLLRLHAGALSVDGLTTHIGLAVEAVQDMERLTQANAEVEAALATARVQVAA